MGLFRLCVFFCLARYGFSVDVDLACPEAWEQGTKATLTCAVDISRWAQPNPCTNSFSYTVDFILQPEGGTGSSACTVLNVDTSCDGTANAQGCGCNKTSTHYNMFYIVVANKATHENRSWNCQPDCLVTSTNPPSNPLSRQTSTGCKKTVFPQPCDNNPCAPGKCTVVNDTRDCDCTDTYYEGPTCEVRITQPPDRGDPVGIGVGLGTGIPFVAVCVALVVVVWKRRRLQRENEEDLRTLERKQTLLTEQMSRCPTCKNFNPAAANSGREPVPDYENAATKTGHKATGRPHNGVADEHV